MLGFEHSALGPRPPARRPGADLAAEAWRRPRADGQLSPMPLYGSGLTVGSTAATRTWIRAPHRGRHLAVHRPRARRLASMSRQLGRLGELDGRLVLSLERRDYLNDCSSKAARWCLRHRRASVVVHPLSLEYTARQGGPAAFGFNLQLSQLAIGGALSRQLDAVRRGHTRLHGGARRVGLTRALAGGRRCRGACLPRPVPRRWCRASSSAPPGPTRWGLRRARGHRRQRPDGVDGMAVSQACRGRAAVGGRPRGRGRPSNHFSALRRAGTRCQVGSVGVGTRVWLGASGWKLDLGVPWRTGDGRAADRRACMSRLRCRCDRPSMPFAAHPSCSRPALITPAQDCDRDETFQRPPPLVPSRPTAQACAAAAAVEKGPCGPCRWPLAGIGGRRPVVAHRARRGQRSGPGQPGRQPHDL